MNPSTIATADDPADPPASASTAPAPLHRLSLNTFLIVAGSSLFFCSKGVFAKCAYRLGADTPTVLCLRMLFALPFFLVAGWIASRREQTRLTVRDWARLGFLGFFGYYLSSYVNFLGLQYVSVGLERIVLYSYPSLVIFGGALFLRKPLSRGVVLAMLVAYGGIVLAFAGEAHGKSGTAADLWKGVGLVFTSAVTYATFILVSGETVRRIGAARFTSCVVGISCVLIMIHYAVTRPLGALTQLPAGVYGYGAILAIFGTVAPSYLLGMGLKRASPQQFAVIGTVGPVVTVVLAWAVLGEPLNLAQGAGFLLSLAGGLGVSLLKSKHP